LGEFLKFNFQVAVESSNKERIEILAHFLGLTLQNVVSFKGLRPLTTGLP
jgi:hypothetical protein